MKSIYCGLLLLATLAPANAGRILDGNITIGTNGNATGYLLGRNGSVGWSMMFLHTTDAVATCQGLGFVGCSITTRLDSTTAMIGANLYRNMISLNASQEWVIRFAEVDKTGWTGEVIERDVAFEYAILAEVQKYLGNDAYKTFFWVKGSGSGRAYVTWLGTTDGLTWHYEPGPTTLLFGAPPAESLAAPEVYTTTAGEVQ